MNVGIIGFGQIGQAIKQVVEKKHRVFARDLDFDQIKKNRIDILHLCYPFDKNFTTNAIRYIKEIKPNLVIIESTVKVGTTEKIYRKTGVNLVHSPVRGVHPHLYEGVMNFPKYIGSTSKKAGIIAKKYYQDLGIKVELFDDSRTTELAKLMCTTYYGWNIIFEKEMYKLCHKYGVNFDQAYSRWNQSYNRGYRQLGMGYVVRPVLKHIPGPIGGHCVISNCGLITSSITRIISKFNKNY